ncbi:MAG: glycosyltransferase [Chitinivibrionales bacterium]|nr:glycosyltransferase [Chitinivibrionales bacterium]
MISVIVCSRCEPHWKSHEENVATTIGAPCEYLRIDNKENRLGLCAAYNEGVARSSGDILVFVHEDAFFLEPGWGAVLERKFAEPAVGLIGVAGTQYLMENDLRWHQAGQPFIRGRVIHDLRTRGIYALSVMSWDKADAEVVAADGVFLAIRASLFDRVCFDEDAFGGFHFYDLDICMQVRRHARCIVTWDVLVVHFSEGMRDEGWNAAAQAFREKYAAWLPVSCAAGRPDPNRAIPAKDYDIKGKVPQLDIG